MRVDTKTEHASVGGGSNKQPQQQAATAAPDARTPQQFSKDSALGSGGVRPDRKIVGGAIVPPPEGEPPGISGPELPGGAGVLATPAGVAVAAAPPPKAREPPGSAGSSGSTTKSGLVRPKSSCAPAVLQGTVCCDEVLLSCWHAAGPWRSFKFAPSSSLGAFILKVADWNGAARPSL